MSISEKCRLCGFSKEKVELIDIDEDSVLESMRKCGILLENNKLLTNFICLDCSQIIESFSKFMDRIIEVQQILNEELSKKLTIVYLEEPDISIKSEKSLTRTTKRKATRPRIKEEAKKEIISKKGKTIKKTQRKRKSDNSKNEFIRSNKIYQVEEIFEKELRGIFIKTPEKLQKTLPGEVNIDGSLTEKALERLSEFNWSHFKWPCEKCNFKANNFEEIVNHSRESHKSEAFIKCEFCPKVCRNKCSFINHHNFEHNDNLKFCCLFCNMYFGDSLQLFQHQLKDHKDKKIFTCLYCAKFYDKGSFLQKHSLSHNTSQEVRLFTCDLCGFGFKVKNAIQVHMTTHMQLNEKSHICEICGMGFSKKGGLMGHMYSHKDSKEFQCSQCKKTFRLKNHLKRHLLTHSSIKPFVCSVCGKTFLQNRTLKAHFRIHSGDLPYTCEFCGKKFRFDSCYSDHRRLHTGERPYVCSECPSAYANYSNYSKHMKGHHGIDPSKKKKESLQQTENETVKKVFGPNYFSGNNSSL